MADGDAARAGTARVPAGGGDSGWRPMQGAPKDGSRILAVIRGGEQGAAEIDVVRWTRPSNSPDPAWLSTDSSRDCPIAYEEWEVQHWMPLPATMPGVRTPDMASTLPAVPAAGEEAGGSGI